MYISSYRCEYVLSVFCHVIEELTVGTYAFSLESISTALFPLSSGNTSVRELNVSFRVEVLLQDVHVIFWMNFPEKHSTNAGENVSRLSKSTLWVRLASQ